MAWPPRWWRSKYRIEKVSRQITPGAGPPELFPESDCHIGRVNQEVRRIMADLRPAVLDDLGILPALNWLCREFEKTYGHIRVEKRPEVSENEWRRPRKRPSSD